MKIFISKESDGHYEFYNEDEFFIRSCDCDELEETKKIIENENGGLLLDFVML